jgi:hypothetical protein
MITSPIPASLSPLSRTPPLRTCNLINMALRPGDTPYPRPNPCPPLTPSGGNGKKPDPLEKGMWE